MTLPRECSFALYGLDPYGEMSTRKVDALRKRIRAAALPERTLSEILKGQRNANFHRAKGAGFLFSSTGAINTADPWVSEMLRRPRG